MEKLSRRNFLTIAVKGTLIGITAPFVGPFLQAEGSQTELPDPMEQNLEEDSSPELSKVLSLGYRLTDKIWDGIASYYSKSGCLGCRTDQKMANGEILDDTKLTLAFMRVALNSVVLVRNLDNNTFAVAKVTDRGGFERHGWIADLSLGLKNEIQGEDLTPVKITLLAPARIIPSSRGAFWPGSDDEVSESPWPQSDEFSPE